MYFTQMKHFVTSDIQGFIPGTDCIARASSTMLLNTDCPIVTDNMSIQKSRHNRPQFLFETVLFRQSLVSMMPADALALHVIKSSETMVHY